MTDNLMKDDDERQRELTSCSKAGSGPAGRHWTREELYDRYDGKSDVWSVIECFRAKADLEALAADDVWEDMRDPSPGRDVEL